MTLQANDIRVRFQGLIALDGVSVSVEPGETVAVVGPNGSGKSTLFNAITGFVPLHQGRVVVDDRDVSTGTADARIRAGVARTFQTPRIDPDLTMLNSILCGFLPSLRSALIPSVLGGPGVRPGERRARAKAEELLAAFGIADSRDVPMGQLPLGTVRIADVLRAIAMSPRYLLLDEPAAGLSSDEQRKLTAGMEHISRQGVGILLVEHNFPLVRAVADRLVVLEKGTVLASGDPAEVAADPRVVSAYLGSGGERADGRPEPDPIVTGPGTPTVALELKSVRVAYGRAEACRDVDLTVERGQITAILGPNGAGKSSLLAALAGLKNDGRRWGGTVELDGREITSLPAERRISRGLTLVPERRGNMFPGLTVAENLQIACRVLPRVERTAKAKSMEELFPVLHRLRANASGLLSGGEQQMLALAMALCANPSVLMLDEPTQGLAPTILDDLVDVFLRLRSDGPAILVAEQNQAFAAAIADRFVVLSHGRIAASGHRGELGDRRAIADAYL